VPYYKSQNIPPTFNLLLSTSNISFLSWKEAFSVEELFLKPYYSVAHTLFWLVCWYNLVYITFSRIFEKDVSKEIGLKLVVSVWSPCLYKGFISDNFNWEGKIPGESDLLHMYVRGDVMKGVFTFRIFIGIPSYL
jgi:hypothetical protein